jgi:hypothetical protein
LNEALDALAQVPDDIADQMIPVGRRHHLAVERAGLDSMVQGHSTTIVLRQAARSQR